MVETSSTKKVREQLAECTQKPIVIESLEQLSKQKGLSSVMTYAGASQINESAINIFLNYDKPDTHESTFVHEVLHAILRFEQYPSIEINQEFAKQNIKNSDYDSLSMLRNKFGSSITHPEIFRRMIQLFDYNVNSYFKNLMKIKIQRLKRKKESKIKKEVFYSQQDIMDSIDYFYYLEPYKSELIENYKRYSEKAYTSSLSLNRKLAEITFYEQEGCSSAAEIIKTHIITYGKRKGLKYENNLWRSLEIQENR